MRPGAWSPLPPRGGLLKQQCLREPRTHFRWRKGLVGGRGPQNNASCVSGFPSTSDFHPGASGALWWSLGVGAGSCTSANDHQANGSSARPCVPGMCGGQAPEPVLPRVHFWLSDETATEYLMLGLRGVRFSPLLS